jgi:hypothetical protein
VASLSNVPTIIDGAPGNVITLPGSFVVASGASVVLQGQGIVVPEWLPLASSTIPATTIDCGGVFASSSVQFTVPDGAVTGPLLITSGDASTVGVTLRVVSQYLSAADYYGEGVDLSALAPASTTAPLYSSGGELDLILRKASSYIDSWTASGLTNDGWSLHYKPRFETHAWRRSRRIYPLAMPIYENDLFIVRISNTQTAAISPKDIVINSGQRYIEILSYAVASYALLGAIQNLGLIANIVELSYQAGFKLDRIPGPIRQATMMIATELLNYRQIVSYGLGGLSSAKQGNQSFDRRAEGFQIPKPALELIRPYCVRRLG